MKTEVIGKVTRETFDSLAEFADTAEERFKGDLDKRRSSWDGNVSMREALAMARYGWSEENSEAMAIAENAVKALERDGDIQSFNRPRWDVTGSDVDVARFLSGEPECMIDMPLNPVKSTVPTVVLVKSFTFVSDMTDVEMMEHGRLIVALALALEKMGVPVEVWADRPLNNANTPSGYYYQRILLKGGNDILDAGQLQFALVHPAMLRKLGFAVQSAASPRNRRAEEKDLYGEGAILTETIPPGGDAVEFLKAELARLGLIESE